MADNESLSSIIEKLKKRRAASEEETPSGPSQESAAEAAQAASAAAEGEAPAGGEDAAKESAPAEAEAVADSAEETGKDAGLSADDLFDGSESGHQSIVDDDLFASLVSDLREEFGVSPDEASAEAPDLNAFMASDSADAEAVDTDGAGDLTEADGKEELISSIMNDLALNTESAPEDGTEAEAGDTVFAESADEAVGTGIGEGSFGIASGEEEVPSGSDFSAKEARDDVSSGTSESDETAGEEHARADGQLSDDMLLAAFGYADTSRGTGDTATPQAQKPAPSRTPSSLQRHKAGSVDSNLDLAFGYDGKEYKDRSQNGKILADFDRDKRKMYVRLGGTLLFFILCAVFDLASKKFGGALEAATFPVVNIMISLQLLLICAAFSLKKLYLGLAGIVRARPIPASLTATVVLLTALYDILIAIASPEKGFALYNSPAAFCLLMTALADAAELFRQAENFRSISSWDSVTTIEKADSEAGSYRLMRGSFADGFFIRSNRTDRKYGILNYIIAPVVALALIMMIITLAKKDSGFGQAMNVFIVTLQFSLPAFAVIAEAIPFASFCFGLFGRSTVILHETDTADFAPVRSIVLDETDMFGEGSLKIGRVRMCSPDADIYSVMTDTSAICSEIGGTISTAFNRISEETDTDDGRKVVINRVADGGIDAYAGGRHYIIGSRDFLSENSIVCNGCDDGSYLSVTPRGAVLHIAQDGTEVVRLYMEYNPGKSFTELLDSFRGRRISVKLHCVDPNINTEFVRSMIGAADIDIEVIRDGSASGDAAGQSGSGKGRVSGGLLSRGDEWLSLIETAGRCGNYRSAAKLNYLIMAGFTVVGVLLSVILGLFGAAVGMSAAYILLFCVLSVIPSVLIARFYLA